MRYISQGLKRDTALQISGVTKHQYYYKNKRSKPGKKPTLWVKKTSGEKVENKQVVKRIEQYQSDNDTDYGYRKITYALKQEGYHMNHKKVYSLMKTNQLLKKQVKKHQKTYAKYRKILPQSPLELLEMDIKMVWLEECKRHGYVLTLIDTFTRMCLHRKVALSIKKEDVKTFWEEVIAHYLQPFDCLKRKLKIEIRNDNDKRFSAQMVQDFFKENYLNQVFTRPYTPQENGHIESFHAILRNHLKKYLFWDIEELKQNLSVFYFKYNTERIHGSIAYLSPLNFWKLWQLNLIEMKVNYKKRNMKFKLKIPYQNVKQIMGKYESEGSSLHSPFVPDEANKLKQEILSADTSLNNLRYKNSPSVVPCSAKSSHKNLPLQN